MVDKISHSLFCMLSKLDSWACIIFSLMDSNISSSNSPFRTFFISPMTRSSADRNVWKSSLGRNWKPMPPWSMPPIGKALALRILFSTLNLSRKPVLDELLNKFRITSNTSRSVWFGGTVLNPIIPNLIGVILRLTISLPPKGPSLISIGLISSPRFKRPNFFAMVPLISSGYISPDRIRYILFAI